MGFVRIGDWVKDDQFDKMNEIVDDIGRSIAPVLALLACQHEVNGIENQDEIQDNNQDEDREEGSNESEDESSDDREDENEKEKMRFVCTEYLNPVIGALVVTLLYGFIDEYDFDGFPISKLARFIWLLWNPFAFCFKNSVSDKMQDATTFALDTIKKRVKERHPNETPKELERLINEAIYKAMMFHYLIIMSYSQNMKDRDVWHAYMQIMHQVTDTYSVIEWMRKVPFDVLHDAVTEIFRKYSLQESKALTVLTIAIVLELFYDGGLPKDPNILKRFYQVRDKKMKVSNNAALQLQSWLSCELGISELPPYIGFGIDSHVRKRILSIAEIILKEKDPKFWSGLSNAGKERLVETVSATLEFEYGIILNEVFGQFGQFIAESKNDEQVRKLKDGVFDKVRAESKLFTQIIDEWDK